jgi:hypothetical protein
MGELKNYLLVKEQCGALASLFYCGISGTILAKPILTRDGYPKGQERLK